MGLLSDFAIDIDDLEVLQTIVVDACNELKISPDHQGFVARVVDLRSQGRAREEILQSLRVEFARLLTVAILPLIHEDFGDRIEVPAQR
ncbi:hypothetical protein HB775_07685 [Rhizobium leguminosarum bv. trifolii]|nr:hypothetical protein HB775_07685 [Rhizobium leguminosarum bv. trifolii]